MLLCFKRLRPTSYASQWFGPLAPIHQTPHTSALEHSGTSLSYQLSSVYSQVFLLWQAGKSQKKTKHSAINHLIHFLNTCAVVVGVQRVCYSTRPSLTHAHITKSSQFILQVSKYLSTHVFFNIVPLRKRKNRRGKQNIPGWRMRRTVGWCKMVYWPTCCFFFLKKRKLTTS